MPPQDEMAVPAAASAADELEKSGATKPDNVDRSDFLSFVRTKGAPPPKPAAPKPPEFAYDKTPPSHHRAVYGLRNGHLHKALGVDNGESLTPDHIKRGKSSKNPHVKAMSDLAE